MTRHRLGLVFLVAISLLTSSLSAAEPYLQFVEGLREREYFDTAFEYLESIETRPDLPEEIKVVIPFEKATTLLQLARTQRNPESANATLGRAQAFLDQFLKSQPDHPLAAKANSDAANVLLGKGKVAVLQARSPSNANKRGEFIKSARENFEQARKMFQDAATKYDKEWQGYGPYIDSSKEPEKYEAKQMAERMKIRAELDVGIVQYEEAQIYEKDDPQYQQLLKEASDKFELIHQKHRSLVAGLVARTYQGKCFEEQGDLQKALGIYNELLTHKSEPGVMQNLQAQVTYFKLICLNSDQRADHVLVDAEAQKWIKENPTMLRTRFGIGIRFEQARALEAMAKSRELKEDDRKKMLNEALSAARVVNRGGIEFRDASQSMITRLMAALNRDGSDPKDFDTAAGMARELVNRIKEVKDAVRGAPNPEEKAKRQRDFEQHLTESARLLNLALALRKPETKLKDVNLVRYSLCYVLYEQQRSYDAAVLGEFVARRYADNKDDEMGSTPADAAYLAMAAYAQAYNRKGNADKGVEIQRMIDIAEFVVSKWPGTPKAIDALVMLGQMHIQTKDFIKAAETLQKVPEDSGAYLKVQLMLGQALWEATIDGLNKPEKDRPSAETLADYQTRARDVLQKAISTLEPKLAENEPLSEDLVLAKLTLTQMANQTAQYPEALKLLETDKRSILSAISVADGETRPALGVKSSKFAQEVYKQLLRAYIGLQNLDNARKAMTELEKLATSDGQDILPIYIELGRQFKEELDRLNKSNPAQYQTVLKSFESFLGNMLARKEGQNYNSLAWIGAMYISLGEASPDSVTASVYFKQGATAFQELIDRAGADPSFCTDQQLLVAKVQAVACQRKSGNFEAAVEQLKEILKLRQNSIDTQTEACYVYQDWAASGQTDSPKQWRVAMLGDRELPASGRIGMWGWAELSKRILQSPQASKFTEQFLEARYNIALCLLRSSIDLTGPKKMDGLVRAQTEIQRTSMQVELDDKQFDKFNALHQEVQSAMGVPTSDLERAPVIAVASQSASAEDADEQPRSKKAKARKKATVAQAPAPAPSTGSTMYLMIGVFVLAGIGGAVWFFKNGTKGRRRSVVSSLATSDEPLFAAAPSRKSGSAGTAASAPARPRTSRPKE